jgi:hypothetical protein
VLAVPVFCKVNGWLVLGIPTVWVPNARLVGLVVTVVGAAVAVPDRVTTCGEFDALSVTAMFPVKFPAVVGANAALTVQLAPAARVAGATGQAIVIGDDSLKLVLAVIAIVVAVLPVFFTVIVWGALVWSTTVEEKERVVGVAVTVVAPLPAPCDT